MQWFGLSGDESRRHQVRHAASNRNRTDELPQPATSGRRMHARDVFDDENNGYQWQLRNDNVFQLLQPKSAWNGSLERAANCSVGHERWAEPFVWLYGNGDDGRDKEAVSNLRCGQYRTKPRLFVHLHWKSLWQ